MSIPASAGPNRRAVLAAAATAATFAAGSSRAADGPVAQTTSGKIRGFNVGPVKAFKGVPYGAPTGGANRFMPPKPVVSWTGVRDTVAFGDQSPQTPSHIMPEEQVSLDATPIGEDCLKLNVWTTGLRDGRKRPVMVWFHGGGFMAGSGGNLRTEGVNLAQKHDVVAITVNHRLNAFGFLYLGDLDPRFAASGSAGTLDLVAALTWVRDNIAEFGGDPGNVTIFGQSGGGAKVTTLMAMPAAKGLFHRAIAESGLVIRATPAANGTATARRFLGALNLKPDQLGELQALPFKTIVDMMISGPRMGFAPVVDGKILPADPFEPGAPALSANVPMMLGSTLTESVFQGAPVDPIGDATLKANVKANCSLDDAAADQLIALYRKGHPGADQTFIYQLISTDNWLTANVATVAERKAALGRAPAYVYHFEKLTPVRGGKLRSPHTLEIPYVFDNLSIPNSALVTGTGPERQALADKMSGAWTAFARTGDPNAKGLPKWTPYSANNRAVMIFNDACKLVVDPHGEERIAMQAIHEKTPTPPRA